MYPFYLLKELQSLGLGGFGNNVIIKRTVQFYKPEKIFLGDNVIIDDFVIMVAKKDVVIGNNVHVGAFSALYGRYGIHLQDYSGLSDRVTLYTESDDYSGLSMTNPTVPISFKPKYATGPILVKKHVIIGTNSTLMPNVTLEEGVAVGAYTFVTRNCAAWWIYSGSPAKKMMKRRENVLELSAKYERTRRH